jgi:galactose-1-phosphate uridylyltransferase
MCGDSRVNARQSAKSKSGNEDPKRNKRTDAPRIIENEYPRLRIEMPESETPKKHGDAAREKK